MQVSELKEKSTEDLQARMETLQAESFNLKFQLATEQISNTARLKKTRKDLARIKTLIRERELGIQPAPEVDETDTGAAEGEE